MISKELLSEVLGQKVLGCYFIGDKKAFEFGFVVGINDILVEDVCSTECYNLYELANKCKNFAFDRGYRIVEDEFCIRIKHLSTGKFKIYEYSEEERTEGIVFKPEYTFKACQLILDNKES